MREAAIERHLTRVVRQAGGISIKILPVTAGVPDRLLVLPGGRLRFVETKAPGGRLRPVQKAFHARLAKLGVEVTVLSSPEEVRDWIQKEIDSEGQDHTDNP